MPVALVAPEQPPHGRAGLRRPHAGRGPAADGHRLRPAGRRARLSAARRPRALPRGLRRSAPPTTRAAWPTASSTRRRRCGASWSSAARTSPRPAEPRGGEPCERGASLRARVAPHQARSSPLGAVVVPRRLGFLLARYLSTENRERDAVYDAAARPGARRRAPACCAGSHGCDARCRADVEAQRAQARARRAT